MGEVRWTACGEQPVATAEAVAVAAAAAAGPRRLEEAREGARGRWLTSTAAHCGH